MRTGAAGVIVGIGADDWSTTDEVLGIRVPMATAIADAAAARARLPRRDRRPLRARHRRRRHRTPRGDIAKAIGCGADAVMLGEPLSAAPRRPAGGAWWHSGRRHPKLPRGAFGVAGGAAGLAGAGAVRPVRRPGRLAQPVRRRCAGRWPSAATAT